ncbi:MAG: hypothetical protein K0R67_1507 [Paenibacillus sp.]|nr:hypothetical protein [Paenibacillus sp.]
MLGVERIQCSHDGELESFRNVLKRTHPRLLMMFKANVLLGEPTESDPSAIQADRCGTGRLPFSLSDNMPIVFDSSSQSLSSCAEAFIKRLLPLQEAQQLIHAIELEPASPDQHRDWLMTMQTWLNEGKYVILIQEDQAL